MSLGVYAKIVASLSYRDTKLKTAGKHSARTARTARPTVGFAPLPPGRRRRRRPAHRVCVPTTPTGWIASPVLALGPISTAACWRSLPRFVSRARRIIRGSRSGRASRPVPWLADRGTGVGGDFLRPAGGRRCRRRASPDVSAATEVRRARERLRRASPRAIPACGGP